MSSSTETLDPSDKGTYGIKGLPRPDQLVDKTKNIPFVPGLPARRDIQTLYRSTDAGDRKQWTLFVLGLEKFKNKPVKEKLSYFQVAGIHVSPNQGWDHAPDPGHTVGEGHIFPGYCFHNGLNFPTFHRPYMLLFEQCVWDNMKAVIDDWTAHPEFSSDEKEDWLKAADAWRLPYWDWAAKQTYTKEVALPELVLQGPVRIFPPVSLKKFFPPGGWYPNPFWNFENPEKDANGDSLPFGQMPEDSQQWNIKPGVIDEQILPWDRATGTSRYGVFREPDVSKAQDPDDTPEQKEDKYTYIGLEGVNNAWAANSVFASMREVNKWYDPGKETKPFEGPGTFSDAVQRMFSPGYYKYWEQFTSTKWYGEWKAGEAHDGSEQPYDPLHHPSDPPTSYLSLEYIHNNLHNLTGGRTWELGMGHMGDVAVAAFDPIFWLHHCQVDRLFAIWQALNWDLWWNGPDEVPDDGVNTDNRFTRLEPFHLKDNDQAKVKDVYTPDQTRDWTKLSYTYSDLADAAVGATNADGTLNEDLYKAALLKRMNDLYDSSATIYQAAISHPPADVPKKLQRLHRDLTSFGDHKWLDYIINVVYDRYALNGAAYAIEFYLGASETADKVRARPGNFVGQVYTFSNSKGETCGNCKTQQVAGVLSRAQVPLTLHLLHHVNDSVDEHRLASFRHDDIHEYLKSHLHWRFVLLGGKELPADRFPKTYITVLGGTAQLNKSEEHGGAHFATYHSHEPLPEVTDGKPWGLKLVPE